MIWVSFMTFFQNANSYTCMCASELCWMCSTGQALSVPGFQAFPRFGVKWEAMGGNQGTHFSSSILKSFPVVINRKQGHWFAELFLNRSKITVMTRIHSSNFQHLELCAPRNFQ